MHILKNFSVQFTGFTEFQISKKFSKLSSVLLLLKKKITQYKLLEKNVLSVLIPLSMSLPIYSGLSIVHYLKNSSILKTETSFFFLHFYHIILVLELWSNSSVRKPRKQQTEPGAHFTVMLGSSWGHLPGVHRPDIWAPYSVPAVSSLNSLKLSWRAL